MNQQLLYACSCVGRGWWPLLEKYISAILEIDPGCEFEPKEKFGELRLQAICSMDYEHEKKEQIWRLEQEAEDLSRTVCEYCGKPGRLRHKNRSWYLTLCDECDGLDKDAVYDLYLCERVLIGKKYEELIEPERKNELWKQWFGFPVKSILKNEEYHAWYECLTSEEQSVVLGWNAALEERTRKKGV